MVSQALREIRSLAEEALRSGDAVSGKAHGEVFDRIRFLADLCNNMPSCTWDLVQIRAFAGSTARRRAEEQGISVAAQYGRILSLAEGCLADPSFGVRERRRRRRADSESRRERAMRRRPLAYAWSTSGPEARSWVMRQVADAGLRWTAPPPLPLGSGKGT
ncbi:hypothetical protein OG216_20805 [Streptomycetaceae bacterium NBC_01309]